MHSRIYSASPVLLTLLWQRIWMSRCRMNPLFCKTFLSGWNRAFPGERCWFLRSGSGKSTLLRALAGIWPYVKGTLEIPEESKLMFIPQRPYLPLGTLKESLLYPGTESRTDEELKQLMEDCCIGYLYDKLYMEADWSHVLSVGEQQRLAFVRALIYKPVWLFLDEASSALDEETEAKVYTLLMEEAQQTTLVSVGHRSTLNKYHQKVLYLDKETHSLYWQEKTLL